MKINGIKIDAHFVEHVVIPRPTGNIIFKAAPLSKQQNDDFDSMCPIPQPPSILMRGQSVATIDTTDTDYLAARNEWAVKKTDYMFVVSLLHTEGLEWSNIKLDDPETWKLVPKELNECGFMDNEVTAIFNGVISANGLDSVKIEQATKDFLVGQALASN